MTSALYLFIRNVGRNNNGPKVANFLVVSNDLHETWNDSIAVLRTRHGEIFISTNDMLTKVY